MSKTQEKFKKLTKDEINILQEILMLIPLEITGNNIYTDKKGNIKIDEEKTDLNKFKIPINSVNSFNLMQFLGKVAAGNVSGFNVTNVTQYIAFLCKTIGVDINSVAEVGQDNFIKLALPVNNNNTNDIKIAEKNIMCAIDLGADTHQKGLMKRESGFPSSGINAYDFNKLVELEWKKNSDILKSYYEDIYEGKKHLR